MIQNAPLTFADDKLETKPFAEKLERFLLIEHDFVDEGLVVSVNAPFGAGKSTFIEMWKSDLLDRRKSDSATPLPIVLNAWKSDYCGDPLIAILSAFTIAAEANSDGPKSSGKLRDAVKDLSWLAVSIGNDVVSKLTGVNVADLAKSPQEKNEKRNEKPDIVKRFEEREEALSKVKFLLRESFGGESPKAIVFVDELDRCRPDFAISYLETIKHVFDIHGLIFVIAVDYEQLKSSACALFGHNMNFPEYLRKFIHRSFALPQPNPNARGKLLAHYAERYLTKEAKRYPWFSIRDRLPNITELLSTLAITPRQVQEVFRIVGHLVGLSKKPAGDMHWCYGVGGILMAGLKVANPPMYHGIGTGSKSYPDVGRYLVTLLGVDRGEWWFLVYLAGSLRGDVGQIEDISAIMENSGFGTSNRFQRIKDFAGQFFMGWGDGVYNYKSPIVGVYARIESAEAFGS